MSYTVDSETHEEKEDIYTNLERWAGRAEHAGKICVNISKIAALLSTILGLILVEAYLSSVGAPFPSIDSGFSLLLMVISATFIFIVGLIVAYLTIPTHAKFMAWSEIKTKFPAVFGASEEGYRIEYFLMYAPFIVCSACLCLFVIVDSFHIFMISREYHEILTAYWFPIAFFGGMLFSIVLYLCSTPRTQWLEFVFFSGLINVLSLAWLYMLFILLGNGGLADYVPDMTEGAAAIVFVIAVMLFAFLHYKATKKNIPFARWLMAASFLMVSLLMIVGPSYWGAVTLRKLNIGGGIPISLKLKQGDGEKIQGCAILLTSTAVYLKQPDDAKKCSISPFATTKQASPLQGIVVYLRADIREEGEFHPQAAAKSGASGD